MNVYGVVGVSGNACLKPGELLWLEDITESEYGAYGAMGVASDVPFSGVQGPQGT